MIGTALLLLCATAVALAELDDTELDGFYDNGCPKDTSIDKLLPHRDCDQYYQCFHGALISRFCPNGLHFNADLEKCDWVGQFDCHKKREDDNRTQLDKSNPSHVHLICSSTESNGVLVAHKNCHQFNKCLDGRPLVLNCAKDLLYNTAIQQCDWPQNVNCGKRLRIINDTIITTTVMDLGYSLSIEEIDQSNADPSAAMTQCSARRSDGLLVPHEYCNKFYRCSGGVPMTITCPSTLLYNPNKELCDWPGNVDCDGRVTTYVEGNVNRANAKNNIDSEDNEIPGDEEDSAITICAAENTDGIMVAHEKCNYFYKCSGNKPVAFNCPGDLLFNAKNNYCDWSNNVDCGERINTNNVDKDEKYEDPRQADTICSAEGSDGVLVAHDHCNKYYKCRDGFAVVVKCAGILLYNPQTENCDWPTHVYCKDRIVPENGHSYNEGDDKNLDSNSIDDGENNVERKSQYVTKRKEKIRNVYVNLSNAAYTCDDEDNNGKLLPHENCNQFYKCVERKAVALFCPLNLYYNIQKQSCDWSYSVKCGNRLTPSNDSNGEDSKNTNLSCQGKLDGSVVPHENCSQFYKCINGKSYNMDCPPGLYFSANFKVCDWPMNVDCGKRLTETQLMKKRRTREWSTALFLLYATAVAHTELDDTDGYYENGCPKDNSIEKLLPHENCGQYYQCFHGALISRFCPNGLNFNADLERCDWQARCNKRVEVNKTVFEELDTNNPRDASVICSSPDSNDILVAHENCDEFYKCSHGRPVVLKCAAHLLYNTLTEKCDSKESVDCGERNGGASEVGIIINNENKDLEDTTSIEEIKHVIFDHSQATILCKSTQSDGVLIAHEYCNKFYKCSGGKPIPKKCPNKQWYDPIKGRCDWPLHVRCNGRIIPKAEDSTNKAASEEKNNDEENELSGDDDDSSPTGICAAENSEGDVAAHEKCNQFYKCSGKEPVAFTCPGNLLFNTKKNFCDWPNNVDCGDRTESGDSDRVIKIQKNSGDSTKEKKARIICSAKGSDGVMATHKSCNKFYKCRNGRPITVKCPGMLMYNPNTQKCDWPTHVSCTNRTIPKNGQPPHIYYSKEDIASESANNNENSVDSGTAPVDNSTAEKENENNENNLHNQKVRGFQNSEDHDSGYVEINDNIENAYDEKNNMQIQDPDGQISRYLNDAAKICASKNSEGILLPHENCNQYFKCSQKIPVAQFCQLHLFYNPKKEYCDWLQNVNCSDRAVPETHSYPEKEAAFVEGSCTGLPDGSILPHENCSQFYKCVNGQKYAMECLQGLYYNNVHKVCDWPMNVDCGERLTEAEVRNQMGLQ